MTDSPTAQVSGWSAPGSRKESARWATAAIPMDNPYCSCKLTRHLWGQLSKGEKANVFVGSRLAADKCETVYEVKLDDIDSPPTTGALMKLPLPQREEIISAFYAKFDASKTPADVKDIVTRRKDVPFTKLLGSLQKKYSQTQEDIMILWRLAQTQQPPAAAAAAAAAARTPEKAAAAASPSARSPAPSTPPAVKPLAASSTFGSGFKPAGFGERPHPPCA